MSDEIPEWALLFMGLGKEEKASPPESLPISEATHKSKLSKTNRKGKRKDRELARKFKKGL